MIPVRTFCGDVLERKTFWLNCSQRILNSPIHLFEKIRHSAGHFRSIALLLQQAHGLSLHVALAFPRLQSSEERKHLIAAALLVVLQKNKRSLVLFFFFLL